MSSAYIMGVFVVIIAILIVLVAKYKFHAVVALFGCAFLLGILIKTPLGEIPGLINSGFGSTCASVGIVIILGSLLGEIMSATGAAVRITKTFIKWFGKKGVLAAVGASSCLLGIPIFPDTVSLLLIPMCTNLAAQTGISMVAFASVIGINITSSSLVPPTPGPVAAAAILGLPLGVTIPWGTLVSIPSLVVAVAWASRLTKKQIPLNEAYLSGSAIPEDKLPSFTSSMGPILIPIVLIVADTVCTAAFPESKMRAICSFFGAPITALTIGCLMSVFFQLNDWRKNMNVRSKWIDNAIVGSAGPIFITALGGSLAAFIKNAGAAELLAQMIVDANVPGIFVPMLIAFLIRVITGSNTLAVSTAAALCQPMLGVLGLSPLAAFLATCSGGIPFSHANSSGFWLVSTMCKLDVKDSFWAITMGTMLTGFTACITTLVLYFFGII